MKTSTPFKTAAFLALLSPSLFAAQTLKFELDRALVFLEQTPDGKTPWVSVTITELNETQVRFDVSANLTGSQFITDVAFNFDSRLDIKKLAFSDFKSKGSFTLPTVSLASDLMTSGQITRFDAHLFFSNSEKTGASKLFSNNDSLSFVASYSGAGFSASSFDFSDYSGQATMGAYVAGIGACNDAIWIAPSKPSTSVPETSSLLLGMASTLLLAKRKRSQK